MVDDKKLFKWEEKDGKKKLILQGEKKDLWKVDWKVLMIVFLVVMSYFMMGDCRDIANDPCSYCSCCEQIKGYYEDTGINLTNNLSLNYSWVVEEDG